jgi:hypothetical protein
MQTELFMLFIISITHGIYTYTPETNPISRVCCVAALLVIIYDPYNAISNVICFVLLH